MLISGYSVKWPSFSLIEFDLALVVPWPFVSYVLSVSCYLKCNLIPLSISGLGSRKIQRHCWTRIERSLLKPEMHTSNCLRNQRRDLRKYQRVSGQRNYASHFCFVNSSVGIVLPSTGSPTPSKTMDCAFINCALLVSKASDSSFHHARIHEMRDITNQFISTGVYSIKNVAFGQLLSLQQGQDSLQGSSASTDLSDRVSFLLGINSLLAIEASVISVDRGPSLIE